MMSAGPRPVAILLVPAALMGPLELGNKRAGFLFAVVLCSSTSNIDEWLGQVVFGRVGGCVVGVPLGAEHKSRGVPSYWFVVSVLL